MSTPQATGHCPKCRTALGAGREGVCPRCLIETIMTKPTPTAPVRDLPDLSKLVALFPEFEIGELIGRGGMGAVYRGRHTRLDRSVAIKVLLPDLADSPEFAERFTREARAMARLNHPHVAHIYDFGERGGCFFLVMEYVDGPNLRQLIDGANLSPRDALRIIPQICDALQFAHDRGIVHRDIKPENVLVDEELRVRITDFGLAKILGSEEGSILTRTEQVFGTPQYMAPEQLRGTATVDARADLYSVGVVLYEMLTGDLPVGRFEVPSKQAADVSQEMDRVVLKSLAQKPADRYQTATELKEDMHEPAASEHRATGAALEPPRPTGRAMFSRLDSLFGPSKFLRADDLVYYGVLLGSIAALTLFLPYYKAPNNFTRIAEEFRYTPGVQITGWSLNVSSLPMRLLGVYALVFVALSIAIRFEARLSRRILVLPPILGILQITYLLYLVGMKEAQDPQIGAMVGFAAFVGMLYVAAAHVTPPARSREFGASQAA